jgi:hypothetical protein
MFHSREEDDNESIVKPEVNIEPQNYDIPQHKEETNDEEASTLA